MACLYLPFLVAALLAVLFVAHRTDPGVVQASLAAGLPYVAGAAAVACAVAIGAHGDRFDGLTFVVLTAILASFGFRRRSRPVLWLGLLGYLSIVLSLDKIVGYSRGDGVLVWVPVYLAYVLAQLGALLAVASAVRLGKPLLCTWPLIALLGTHAYLFDLPGSMLRQAYCHRWADLRNLDSRYAYVFFTKLGSGRLHALAEESARRADGTYPVYAIRLQELEPGGRFGISPSDADAENVLLDGSGSMDRQAPYHPRWFRAFVAR